MQASIILQTSGSIRYKLFMRRSTLFNAGTLWASINRVMCDKSVSFSSVPFKSTFLNNGSPGCESGIKMATLPVNQPDYCRDSGKPVVGQMILDPGHSPEGGIPAEVGLVPTS